MAKSLAERITSAKSTDRITITDLETLIADATAERDRLNGSAEHHDAESIDFALSDEDREEASRLAGHYQRTARGLSNEIAALSAKLADKLESDKRKAEEAARAAIVAKRDDLAARLKDRIPALLDELVGLLEEIEANDAEIAPLKLQSAEAIARGVPGNFYSATAPVDRYLRMKIPAWDGRGKLWPIDRFAIAMAQRQKEAQRQLVARQEAEKAEAARWSHYIIDPPEGDEKVTITTHRGSEIVRSRMQRKMTIEGAEAARKAGCTVVEPRPGESLGLPPSAAVYA